MFFLSFIEKMPQIAINYNDDRGRANRENGTNRARNRRRRQQYQMARALQQQEAPVINFEEQVRRQFNSRDVMDLRPLKRLSAVVLLIILMGRKSLLTEACLLMTGNTSRAAAELRAMIDPDYQWVNDLQADFEKHHDPRFSASSRHYILQYETRSEEDNQAFIRRLRRDDFVVNDHRLLLEIVNLIDNQLVEEVNRDVIIYEFLRVLPDSLLTAMAADFFCTKCNELLVGKKELGKHMHLMHKEDIEPQAQRDEIYEDENNYIKILRNTRMKRKIYRMFGDRQQSLQFQKSHRLQMTFTSEEHGVMTYDLNDD
jgi:hypothetical protein